MSLRNPGSALESVIRQLRSPGLAKKEKRRPAGVRSLRFGKGGDEGSGSGQQIDCPRLLDRVGDFAVQFGRDTGDAAG